jgi:hypothetical protein
VLREGVIEDRSTVFEENSLDFCEKHDLGVKKHKVPAGFRATWQRRDQIAAAKLADSLAPDTPTDAFPGILSKVGTPPARDEFVEVHIYGPLHRRSIAKAVIKRPKHAPDVVLVEAMDSQLTSVGATIEIYE